MRAVLRRVLTFTLCLWLVSPVLAQMPAGQWEGSGLIKNLTLSEGWQEGSILLSKNHSLELEAFSDDHQQLSTVKYKIPVKMLISVGEIINKTETVILSSEEFAYHIVLRYNPKSTHFKAVWFDRKDVEVPTTEYILVKDN